MEDEIYQFELDDSNALVDFFLQHFPRHSMETYTRAFDAITRIDHGDPNRHLTLAMATCCNTLRAGKDLQHVGRTWSRTLDRLIAGKNSARFEITKDAINRQFLRRTDEIAGGIIGSAEIRCGRLKSNNAKANTWNKAWVKLTHAVQNISLPEFKNAVTRWDGIAHAYHAFYKSDGDPLSFKAACNVLGLDLELPE